MTARTGWRLSEEELRTWLAELPSDERTLIGPVEDNNLRLFRPVADAAAISLQPGKTRWSPKEYLFPRTQPLYSYSFRGAEVEITEPPEQVRDLILFGLRPCDAAAVARLDAVFLSGVIDPFYARRRAASTIITLACAEAEPECFCTAVGGSPAGEEGSDVMVVNLEEVFLLSPTTDTGKLLIEDHDHNWVPAIEHDWEKAAKQTGRVERSIAAPPLNPTWSSALEQRFGDDVWQEFGELCMACSICSSVCPTCSCFDMAHDGNAWGGAQFRTWDACTFSRFTAHASGHDPRSDQAARYRQRLLHKFAYRTEADPGSFRCVGCGRCSALCPAGLDIHSVVRKIAEGAHEDETHAAG